MNLERNALINEFNNFGLLILLSVYPVKRVVISETEN